MADRSSGADWEVADDAGSGREANGSDGDGAGWILPTLAKLLGGLVGAAVGGAALGYLGYVAFVVGDTDGVGGLAFILGFIVAIFAIVAPFALGKFLGARVGGTVVGELVYGSTFVVSGGFVVALMLGGLYALQVSGIDETFAAFVVFDAVSGVTIGGMGGYSVVEGVLESRGQAELAA